VFGHTLQSQGPESELYYKAIGHVFGHYGLGLYRENADGRGNVAEWEEYRAIHPAEVPTSYGIMDNDAYATEMSSCNDYLPTYSKNPNPKTVTEQFFTTSHGGNSNGMACWQWVEARFQGVYSNIPVEVVVPQYGYYAGNDLRTSEDRPGPDSIPQPYPACVVLSDYTPIGDVGGVLYGMGDAGGSVQPGPTTIEARYGGTLLVGATIVRKQAANGKVTSLGATSRRGYVLAYDLAANDVIEARWRGAKAEYSVAAADIGGRIAVTSRRRRRIGSR